MSEGRFIKWRQVVTRFTEADLDESRLVKIKADPDRRGIDIENHSQGYIDVVFGDVNELRNAVFVGGRHAKNNRMAIHNPPGELHVSVPVHYALDLTRHECDFTLRELYHVAPESEPASP